MNIIKADRIFSLDVLRGLAIFGMILSGVLPWTGLPDWMYHAQVPPPDHKFNPDLPGITWVDLVFPFFLFSMGAAIPLALNRRLEKGESYFNIICHILWRGLVLFAFGIFIGNTQPWSISSHPDNWIRFRCLVGFISWILAFARLPWEFTKKKRVRIFLQSLGILGIIWILATVVKEDGSGFDKSKNDIIIMLLAFGYTVGALIWLLSRNNLMLRLALIGGVAALWIHNISGGLIIQTIDEWIKPINWLFGAGWIQLTLVILPGTIIGDILLNWSKREIQDKNDLGLPFKNLLLILVSLPLIVIAGLIYLKSRYVYSGCLFTIALCLINYFILHQSKTELGKLFQNLFHWSIFFLVAGYLLEPYQGGIKKDPATFSYYFINIGMAISLIIFFYIIIDILKKGWSVGFLKVVGGNAMLAYIAGSYFVSPILNLTYLIKPIDKFIEGNLTLGTIWSFILTFLVCGAVYLFSRGKIYLRV